MQTLSRRVAAIRLQLRRIRISIHHPDLPVMEVIKKRPQRSKISHGKIRNGIVSAGPTKKSQHAALARALTCCIAAGVRFDLRMISIGIEHPDFPVVVIIEKGFDIPARNLARPDDSCVIEVGSVVHPLVQHIVVRTISNDHQMLLGRCP